MDSHPHDPLLSTGPSPRFTLMPSLHSAFRVPLARRARANADARRAARAETIGSAARALRIVASVATRRIRLGADFSMRRSTEGPGDVERYDARQVLIAAYFSLTEPLVEGAITQSEFAALIHCFPNTFSDWLHEYYRGNTGPMRLWATIAPDSARFATEIIAYLRAGHPAGEATLTDLLASPLRDCLTQGRHGGRPR